jgi:hypothetical protein
LKELWNFESSLVSTIGNLVMLVYAVESKLQIVEEKGKYKKKQVAWLIKAPENSMSPKIKHLQYLKVKVMVIGKSQSPKI